MQSREVTTLISCAKHNEILVLCWEFIVFFWQGDGSEFSSVLSKLLIRSEIVPNLCGVWRGTKSAFNFIQIVIFIQQGRA